MTEINDKISKAIETVMAEGTFHADALKRRQEQLDGIKGLELRLKSLIDENLQLKKDNREQDIRIEELTKRAEEAEKRATESAQHKIDNAGDKARAETFRECFSLVFRNTQVRESTFHDTPVVRTLSGGGDYVENHSTQKTITREEE